MKFHHTLALAALALVGTANATTYDLSALGPITTTYTTSGNVAAGTAVTDDFTFTLSATSDVAVTAQDLESAGFWELGGATVTLYSGDVGSGSAIGSGFSFNSTAVETDYSALAAGSYYFEVTGTATYGSYAYGIAASADNGNGTSVVPEPADAALLIAGLGMLAFVGGRRRQR